jgi:tetratricopeptide (TPR) repeat protein
MASLVDKSLVQRSAERFQLHEVVRQFAGEKLRDPAEARQAHAAYFAAWAAGRMQDEELGSFALLAGELENVRAAWQWACEQQDTAALAAMADFLKRYLDVQGRYGEGMALFEQALHALDAPEDAAGLALDARSHLIARLLMARALFTANTGALDQTIAVLESCLSHFHRVQDPAQVMACLGILGKCHGFLGRPEQAAVYFGEQLAAARSLANRREAATALNNLATVLTTLGRVQEAEALLRESLTLRREIQDDPGVSSTLINLAVTLFNQGRYAEEKPLLAEAIEISGRIHHHRNLAGALGNLGTILLREEQYEAALKLFQRGLELHRNAGYRYGAAIALDNVGTAHYYLGNAREAQYYLRQSVLEARAIRADFIALDALAWLASLRARSGEPDVALAWLGMIRRHPQAESETIYHVDAMCSAIAADVSPQAAQAAERLGLRLTLDDIIDQALG